ncbi:MAG: DNA-processing protein DprA [Alkalibacterium sp.]|nr:DNA-processing protein DprA [Alkalibacterium sp.]
MEWSELDLKLNQIAHCPFLTYKEKWLIALEQLPELGVISQNLDTTRRVAGLKRASFLRYEKNMPIMQLTTQYNKQSIHCISILSPLYPVQLRFSYEPPLMLFCKGDISLLSRTLLGVVGARECTSYSETALKSILPDLSASGVGIVSGLAKGVDVMAHKQAMSNGGQTLAVIGTGLDKVYPAANKETQDKMCQTQLVISEYPLNTPPRKHHFPERNRIIAGLSKGVLVIEAKRRSGSLITARLALEEGRDVFAVPGPIDSELSTGCNDLIKAGAIPCTTGTDIRDEWGI